MYIYIYISFSPRRAPPSPTTPFSNLQSPAILYMNRDFGILSHPSAVKI